MPYDPAFAFKQPIPEGAALDGRSAAIARQVDENHRLGKVFLDSRGVPPVYLASRSDPFYEVQVGGSSRALPRPAGGP